MNTICNHDLEYDWREGFAVLFATSAGRMEYDMIYNVRKASENGF